MLYVRTWKERRRVIGGVRTPLQGPGDKVGRFVHVDPESIKADALMEGGQLFNPVRVNGWVGKVWERGVPWPHLE